MKRSEMEGIIATTIAKQAIKAGIEDLSWVNVKELLEVIEFNGMIAPNMTLDSFITLSNGAEIYDVVQGWEEE